MADEAEREQRSLREKLGEEVEVVKKQLAGVQEEADELRMRGQTQRIQLLDEVNSPLRFVGEERRIADGWVVA
jgi:hypothetical protein